VIGTVMMQDVFSGSTMVEASKHGRTSPVIINIPPAKIKKYIYILLVTSIYYKRLYLRQQTTF
jgi:hypothetical protein